MYRIYTMYVQSYRIYTIELYSSWDVKLKMLRYFLAPSSFYFIHMVHRMMEYIILRLGI